MTPLSRSCRVAQDQIVSAVAGSLDPRERLALEAHACRCYRCGEALRDTVATHVALDRAFAPLRAAHTMVAPGRVRLAVRPAPAHPAGFAVLFGAARRLAEATVALGMSAFILSSAVTDRVPAPEAPSSVQHAGNATVHVSRNVDDSQYFFRWVRIGRYAVIDDLLDPSVGLPRADDDAGTPEPVRQSAPR